MKKMFSEMERRRFDRQLKLKNCGERGQVALKQSRVAVIGAGGLGCTVLTSLASTGVGQIKLFDFDRVSLSNLHRQPLYDESDIGKSKAHVARTVLKKINPHCEVIPFDQPLRRHHQRESLRDLDLIIDCTDRFPARANISAICAELEIPHCYASVSGTDGQVALFEPHSACFRCLFPTLPRPGLIKSCDQGGVLGGTALLVASIQAQVAIDYLLSRCKENNKLSKELVTTIHLISSLPFRTDQMSLKRSFSCSQCGDSVNVRYKETNEEPYPIPISCSEVRERLADGWRPMIIDVRDQHELIVGSISESVNIPISDLLRGIEHHATRSHDEVAEQAVNRRGISGDNDLHLVIDEVIISKEVLIYCERGPRAERAALHLHTYLREAPSPFRSMSAISKPVVYEMVGGYSGWRDQVK